MKRITPVSGEPDTFVLPFPCGAACDGATRMASAGNRVRGKDSRTGPEERCSAATVPGEPGMSRIRRTLRKAGYQMVVPKSSV